MVSRSSSDGSRKQAMAAVGLGYIEETVAYSQFTDDLGASGRYDMKDLIPPGAVVLAWRCRVATGFTGGGASATVQLGVSGTIAAFSADTTQSVYVSATIVGAASLAASSGDTAGSATTVRITVTDSADFTNISAGSMTVTVWYLV